MNKADRIKSLESDNKELKRLYESKRKENCELYKEQVDLKLENDKLKKELVVIKAGMDKCIYDRTHKVESICHRLAEDKLYLLKMLADLNRQYIRTMETGCIFTSDDTLKIKVKTDEDKNGNAQG